MSPRLRLLGCRSFVPKPCWFLDPLVSRGGLDVGAALRRDGWVWARSLSLHDAGRVAGDDGPGGNVLGDNATGADEGAFADCDAAKQGGIGADRGSAFHQCGEALPVCFGLQAAANIGSAGEEVVGEHHAVADEDLILQGDTLADEGVARNLAAVANLGSLLNLNEGANLDLVANLAAIEIGEAEDADIAAKLDGGRDEANGVR